MSCLRYLRRFSFKIPKEILKWQLYSDDGNIYFNTRSNENVILVPGSDNSDYAVSASWKISEKFSLTDILLKSDITGQGDINPEPEKPGETDPGEEKPEPGKTDPGIIVPNQGYSGVTSDDSVYKDVLTSFRKEMSAKSSFLITSVYPRIDNRLSMQGLKINIPIQSITQADYFIIARDPDMSRYEQTLQQGMRFVSDIVQFQTLKHDNALPGQYTVTIPYNASYEVDMRRLSVYAYSEKLGKWIRMIGSEVDPINHTVTFLTSYFGRFAVIEDSRTIEFKDVNSRMWSASRINALALAGIINGFYENDVLYFAPKRDITRGEFIKLLVASAGEELDSNADLSKFRDADNVPAWVKPYVQKAVEKVWLKGRGVNGAIYLDVNSPITREEAFTLVYRAFVNEVPDNLERAGFLDMDEVSDFAVDAVNYLALINIISGDGTGRVNPKNKITREETAKVIYECVRWLAYTKR